MRLLINGIPILTGSSGIASYVYFLSKYLEKSDSVQDVTYFYGNKFSRRLAERKRPLFSILGKSIRNKKWLYKALHLVEEAAFKFKFPSGPIDLYHETNYISLPFDGPKVLTVCDLSLCLYPKIHPRGRRSFFEQNFYKGLDSASHFITLSEAIKSEMVSHLGINPNKISVIPLGVDNEIKRVPQETGSITIEKYGLKYGSYILFVGVVEPRKNISSLLQAYSMLPKSMQNQYPLVLAGDRGWQMDHLELEIRQLGISSKVRILGFVPREDLPSIYSGASIFVYPSLYEGFGLPPLEAMACGTPVISSNISGIPEVVGDAGVLCNPLDVSSLKDEIKRVLEDENLRVMMSERGVSRARSFSWQRCAEETLAVYAKVLENRKEIPVSFSRESSSHS